MRIPIPLAKAILIAMAEAAIIFGLFGCNQQPNNSIVITEMVMMESSPVVVTRLIEPVTPLPATPIPDLGENQSLPIALNVAYNNPFPLIDPQIATEAETITLIENLYAQLTRFNSAANRVEPELAASWESSPDGLTWTFHLRDDIYWMHVSPDGLFEQWRQLNAHDVVTGFRRVCDPNINAPTAFVFFIVQGCEAVYRTPGARQSDLAVVGVRAIDDTTVEIKLNQPAAYFLTMTSLWWLTPLPEEKFVEFADPFLDEDRWNAPENIMTSGPFLLSEASLNSQDGGRTLLTRNPLWNLPFAGNIDEVNILHLEPQPAFESWLRRELDVAFVPATEEERVLLDAGNRFQLISEQRVFYVGYNFESEAFRYPEVRRAFGSAADRERLIDEVYAGQAFPMRHFTPPGVLGTPPIAEVGNGYNRDYARLQMAQSPFADCRLMPQIRYLVSASDTALQHAQALKQIWVEELNCDEDTILIEQAQFGALVANTRPDSLNRPDMWDLGWASYFPDAQDWLGNILHCQSPENRALRPCSEVDQLIENAGKINDTEERVRLYRQVENAFFARDGIEPISPILTLAHYRAVHRWMTVYQPPNFGGEQYDTYIIDVALRDLERLE